MGCTFRKAASFEAIPDNYNSVVIRLHRCNQLAALKCWFDVHFTESNLVNSISKERRIAFLMRTFQGRSLHYIYPTGLVVNPYQIVLSAITRVFELFDDDKSIPAFGYGGHLDRPVAGRYFSLSRGVASVT
ncbi:hypothetical protein PsorP6_009514 [Peronosclerospora sorghi]|uniref:Uncharacterized protein n=1 Tax=Peronosclerospora sorghi TaxID=230839 RepID=A0ACC0W124_9STRA|nr:hypothetical protein PsorP6_009514 [Peronosclerospora sorghi]